MARYERKDRFFKKAKGDQYAARSVYKLEELDRRYSLLKKGMRIVDLGCAPGSWMQYLDKILGKKGASVGYDLEPVEVGSGPNVKTYVADVTELTADRVRSELAEILNSVKKKAPAVTEAGTPAPAPPNLRIDGLISDMAPKLTGIRDADQAKSVALTSHALRLAEQLVAPGGFFVAKLFQGRDTDEFVAEIKKVFKDVKLLKPEATRDGSREVFVVARQRRPS